jgi:hypothetical protein
MTWEPLLYIYIGIYVGIICSSMLHILEYWNNTGASYWNILEYLKGIDKERLSGWWLSHPAEKCE